MKRFILKFGLIAGAILSVTMAVSMAFIDRIGDRGELLGYTTMVLAFLLVYFGIRSYRDKAAGGSLAFGKAFGIGLLMTLVASACYVITWEVINYAFLPNFAAQYAAHAIEAARASGATSAQIAEKTRQMAQFQEMYKNPVINVGLTFIEVFPVGLVMTLVSSGILSRRRAPSGPLGSASPASAR